MSYKIIGVMCNRYFYGRTMAQSIVFYAISVADSRLYALYLEQSRFPWLWILDMIFLEKRGAFV